MTIHKKISIIIPIYNAESTISRCVDSVLRQSYKNFEIILVNDGSCDKSLEICINYANRDSRVIIIDKPNGGVSSARNAGIFRSRGEYLQFVDSDDFLDERYCEDLMQAAIALKSDIIISGYRYISEGMLQDNMIHIECKSYTQQEIAHLFPALFVGPFLSSPCNKLYLKRVVQVLFDEDVTMGEDLVFNMKVLSECKYIGISHSTGYNYQVGRSESITTKYTPDGCTSMYKYCNSIYIFLALSLPSEQAEKIRNEIISLSVIGDVIRISTYNIGSVADSIISIKRYLMMFRNKYPDMSLSTQFEYLPHSYVNAALAWLANKEYCRLLVYLVRARKYLKNIYKIRF